ncbi:MAG: hypothetical protein WBM98_01170 [Maribacter sp.]|uniref:hypothetical protein n=1 Tax=Maribacter sp. TaxID=1897614 RepID=UPI003C7579CA
MEVYQVLQERELSARKKMATANTMGINMSSMLYRVHEPYIAVYKDYIDGPLNREPAIYEKLNLVKILTKLLPLLMTALRMKYFRK